MDPSSTELKPFKDAVSQGRIAEVRSALQADPSLANAPIFAFGSRAAANVRGNVAMIDVLLEFGADLNLKSDWWAGGWGLLELNDGAFAEALIERGAKVDVFAAANLDKIDALRTLISEDPARVNARGGDGCRPLHFAHSEAAIDLLLGAGAEIDARDVDHESTVAQWALLLYGAPELRKAANRRVRWLLDRGASPDVFMLAALDDAPGLRALLDRNPQLTSVRVGSKDYPACPDAPGRHIYVYKLNEWRSPYEVATAAGSRAAADVLLQGSSPADRLSAACATGDGEAARALLANDPLLIDQLRTSDPSLLAAAAWQGNVPAVQLMLDLGFDPMACGRQSGTALHNAAWKGSADIVRLIVEHPRSQARLAEIVNAVEPTHDSTPLDWCCHGSSNYGQPSGDYPRVASLLLAAGATPGPNHGDATPAVAEVIRSYQNR